MPIYVRISQIPLLPWVTNLSLNLADDVGGTGSVKKFLSALPHLCALKDLDLRGDIPWPGRGFSTNKIVRYITLSKAKFTSWASFDCFMFYFEAMEGILIQESSIVEARDEFDPPWKGKPLEVLALRATANCADDMARFAKYAATILSQGVDVTLFGSLNFVHGALSQW